MGYYANAALERSYRERSCCGYPSREETLTYYLEDLQAMLSPRCDAARYTGVKGRYRYYEVLWAAAPGERDIYAAIAEVEALLHCEAYRYLRYFLRDFPVEKSRKGMEWGKEFHGTTRNFAI